MAIIIVTVIIAVDVGIVVINAPHKEFLEYTTYTTNTHHLTERPTTQKRNNNKRNTYTDKHAEETT